jgi:hypothetical protein
VAKYVPNKQINRTKYSWLFSLRSSLANYI